MKYPIQFLIGLVALMGTSGVHAQLDYMTSVNTNSENAIKVTISLDNQFAYVIAKKEVQTYTRDLITGLLTFQSAIDSMPDAAWMYELNAISISPDEAYVYAMGVHRAFVFERDVQTGNLTPLQTLNHDFLAGPFNNIVVSSDSRYVYFASRKELMIFSRDMQTGMLTLVDNIEDVNDVPSSSYDISLLLSDDDRLLFVTGGHSVSVYERDASTGLLTFKSILTGDNSVNQGITYSRGSVRSHDSQFIYTVTNSLGSGALNVLSVDPATDELEVIQTENNKIRPGHIAMSEDKKLICISSGPGGVGTGTSIFYDVNSETGLVTELWRYEDSVIYDGFKCFDRDGRNMYTLSGFEDQVHIFGMWPTGIADLGKDAGITLYPNPSSTEFTLSSEHPLSNARLEMFNVQGQKVLEMGNLFGESVVVSTDEIPSGIYMTKLWQHDLAFTFDKVVIRK